MKISSALLQSRYGRKLAH